MLLWCIGATLSFWVGFGIGCFQFDKRWKGGVDKAVGELKGGRGSVVARAHPGRARFFYGSSNARAVLLIVSLVCSRSTTFSNISRGFGQCVKPGISLPYISGVFDDGRSLP